ncbi:MAG: metalloregulator ArsR/SmtB family transcription factor [Erysipelotrichaceae bacterium]|nr:metalloregulator ArsR/SmtB family transcription factor [Erysipelotrichaceae bacterium]
MDFSHLPHNHHPISDELLNNTPDFETFQSAADILKILGDANRIRIFWILCHCEECLINLSAMIGMSSPAISYHLKILKSCNLITSRRDEKEMYYTVADNPQAYFLHKTIEQMIALNQNTKGE